MLADATTHAERPDDEPATSRTGPGAAWRGRLTRIPSTHAVFWLAFLLSVVPTFIRERAAFHTRYYPWGDIAVNSLSVERAEKFQQLVGNYSRVNVHHPGPALFYILGAGEGLFYDALHVVPTPYNAQILGASTYACVFLALAVLSLYRTTRSRGAAAIALGIAFAISARQDMFGHPWFPHLYIAAFLLFTVAGAGLAAGRTSELPLYVLGGGVLIHGHVSFILFVGVTTLLIAVAWWTGYRHRVRAELSEHRKGLIGAGVLLFFIALPMVLQTVLHYPGPWHGYWTYTQHATRQPRTFHEVLTFVNLYWHALHVPTVVFYLAGAAGVLLTVTERVPQRRRLFAMYYAMLVLQTLLVIYYVERGVDRLHPRVTYIYVGYFYKMVPMLLLAVAAAQVWIRLRETAASRASAVPRAVWAAPAALITVVLIIAAVPAGGLSIVFPKNHYFPTIATRIRAAAPAHTRIGLVEDQIDTWPTTSGIGLQLSRDGARWCVRNTDPESTNLYTSIYQCHGSGRRWYVHTTRDPAPAGVHVLWRGHVAGSAKLLSVYVRPDGS